MKKIALSAVLLASLLTLTACGGGGGYETGDKVEGGAFYVAGDKGDYDVLKDYETGCLYLQPHTSRDITPYYDENGEIMGCGEEIEYPKY